MALNAKKTPQTKHGEKARNSCCLFILFALNSLLRNPSNPYVMEQQFPLMSLGSLRMHNDPRVCLLSTAMFQDSKLQILFMLQTTLLTREFFKQIQRKLRKLRIEDILPCVLENIVNERGQSVCIMPAYQCYALAGGPPAEVGTSIGAGPQFQVGNLANFKQAVDPRARKFRLLPPKSVP